MRKRTLVRAGVAAVTIAALVVLASPIGAFGQSSRRPRPRRRRRSCSSREPCAPSKHRTRSARRPSPAKYSVFELNYDTLLRFDKKDIGRVAGPRHELGTQSSDGLTWTFHIRDDATWQDGQKLTAHDIAFTYSFVVKNEIGTLSSYFPYSTPKSFQAPNDSTFVWKTTQPSHRSGVPAVGIHLAGAHLGEDEREEAQATKLPELPVCRLRSVRAHKWDKGQYLDARPPTRTTGAARPSHRRVRLQAVRQRRGDGQRPQDGRDRLRQRASRRTCSTPSRASTASPRTSGSRPGSPT